MPTTNIMEKLQKGRQLQCCAITLRSRSQRVGHTRYMRPEEQVAIFIYTAVTNASNRKAAERFQCSGDTIPK